MQHHFFGKHAHCPQCGWSCSGATGIKLQAEAPVAGDLSLCTNCAAVLVFNHDGTMRDATLVEVSALEPETLAYFAFMRGELLRALQDGTLPRR